MFSSPNFQFLLGLHSYALNQTAILIGCSTLRPYNFIAARLRHALDALNSNIAKVGSPKAKPPASRRESRWLETDLWWCPAPWRRVGVEWQRAQAAGSQSWATSSGYSLTLPSNWTKEEQTVGHYHRTYLRSALPSVLALVEIGDLQSYAEPRPVDWDGMERELKGRYGTGYRRQRRDTVWLNGQLASIWEYKIEKAGGPRLRKLTIGYASGWQSCVLAFTAPARDWERWQAVFGQAVSSFRVGMGGQ